MALKLVLDPVATAEPPTMGGPGGTVHVDFTATQATDCFILTAQYLIKESSAYEFAEGGSPADKHPKSATVAHFVQQQQGEVTYSSGELTIRRDGPSTEAALDIQVEVTGMRIDGATMQKPRKARARIEILSAGLQKMHQESGLGKGEWAAKLSKSLGKGKNKLSAGLITDALNGKKVSENTNRILGKLLSQS